MSAVAVVPHPPRPLNLPTRSPRRLPNFDRPVQLFAARGKVQRMQKEGIIAARQRLIYHIDGTARPVDYGRAENADLVQDVVIRRCSRYIEGGRVDRSPQTHLPKRRGPVDGIRVERVYAVVHSGHVEHVQHALSRHVQGVYVERLRINLAVYRIGVEPAELNGVHIIGIQNSFVQVGIGPVVVIVRGEYVDLRADESGRGRKKSQQSEEVAIPSWRAPSQA